MAFTTEQERRTEPTSLNSPTKLEAAETSDCSIKGGTAADQIQNMVPNQSSPKLSFYRNVGALLKVVIDNPLFRSEEQCA